MQQAGALCQQPEVLQLPWIEEPDSLQGWWNLASDGPSRHLPWRAFHRLPATLDARVFRVRMHRSGKLMITPVVASTEFGIPGFPKDLPAKATNKVRVTVIEIEKCVITFNAVECMGSGAKSEYGATTLQIAFELF